MRTESGGAGPARRACPGRRRVRTAVGQLPGHCRAVAGPLPRRHRPGESAARDAPQSSELQVFSGQFAAETRGIIRYHSVLPPPLAAPSPLGPRVRPLKDAGPDCPRGPDQDPPIRPTRRCPIVGTGSVAPGPPSGHPPNEVWRTFWRRLIKGSRGSAFRRPGVRNPSGLSRFAWRTATAWAGPWMRGRRAPFPSKPNEYRGRRQGLAPAASHTCEPTRKQDS